MLKYRDSNFVTSNLGDHWTDSVGISHGDSVGSAGGQYRVWGPYVVVKGVKNSRKTDYTVRLFNCSSFPSF